MKLRICPFISCWAFSVVDILSNGLNGLGFYYWLVRISGRDPLVLALFGTWEWKEKSRENNKEGKLKEKLVRKLNLLFVLFHLFLGRIFLLGLVLSNSTTPPFP